MRLRHLGNGIPPRAAILSLLLIVIACSTVDINRRILDSEHDDSIEFAHHYHTGCDGFWKFI